jgi:hypothetical protein
VRTKKKPQISPLRCAPVETTNLLQENALSTQWTKGREWLNKFVISTGAQRSGEICGFFSGAHLAGRARVAAGFFWRKSSIFLSSACPRLESTL